MDVGTVLCIEGIHERLSTQSGGGTSTKYQSINLHYLLSMDQEVFEPGTDGGKEGQIRPRAF